jgi:hypothetical protein
MPSCTEIPELACQPLTHDVQYPISVVLNCWCRYNMMQLTCSTAELRQAGAATLTPACSMWLKDAGAYMLATV